MSHFLGHIRSLLMLLHRGIHAWTYFVHTHAHTLTPNLEIIIKLNFTNMLIQAFSTLHELYSTLYHQYLMKESLISRKVMISYNYQYLNGIYQWGRTWIFHLWYILAKSKNKVWFSHSSIIVRLRWGQLLSNLELSC